MFDSFHLGTDRYPGWHWYYLLLLIFSRQFYIYMIYIYIYICIYHIYIIFIYVIYIIYNIYIYINHLNVFKLLKNSTSYAFVRSIFFFVDMNNVCHFQTRGKLTYLWWFIAFLKNIRENFSIAICFDILEYHFIIFWRQLAIHSPEYHNIMGTKCEH